MNLFGKLAGATGNFSVPATANVSSLTIASYTNLLVYSQQLTNALGWAVVTSDAVVASSVVAPDGSTAYQLQSTTNGGYTYSAQSVAANLFYTFSLWVATSSSTQAAAIEIYDATGSSVLGTTTFTATTTWTQVSVTTSAAVTSTHSIYVKIFPGGTGSTGTISVWGCQLQSGSAITPYIATGPLSVTQPIAPFYALGAAHADLWTGNLTVNANLNVQGTPVTLGATTNGYVLAYSTSSGAWSPTAVSGGGSPAGSNTQIQFNNSGSFGASSNLTWSGTVLGVGGAISELTSSTALTLNGNSGATGPTGGAVILNSGTTTLTSGNLLSIQNNGTAKASIDYFGDLTLSGGITCTAGTFSYEVQAEGSGTGLSVTNNATIGGALDCTGNVINIGPVTATDGSYTMSLQTYQPDALNSAVGGFYIYPSSAAYLHFYNPTTNQAFYGIDFTGVNSLVNIPPNLALTNPTPGGGCTISAASASVGWSQMQVMAQSDSTGVEGGVLINGSNYYAMGSGGYICLFARAAGSAGTSGGAITTYASIDYEGNISTVGTVSQTTAATALTLQGGTTSGVIVNSPSTASSGNILQINNGGSSIASVNYLGKLTLSSGINAVGGDFIVDALGDVTTTGYVAQITAATTLNVLGGTTAGVVVGSATSASSGNLLTIENSISSSPATKAAVDYAGNLTLTGHVAQITAGTALTLEGGTTAGVIINSPSSASSGNLLYVENDASIVFNVAFNGHINGSKSTTVGPGGSPSAATSAYGTTWNTNPPASILVYGSDTSFVVWVRENASHTHEFSAGNTLFQVTFANVYANSGFSVVGTPIGTAGTGSTPTLTSGFSAGSFVSGGNTLSCVPTVVSAAGDSFVVFINNAMTAVTVESAWYGFAFHTMCAGSAT